MKKVDFCLGVEQANEIVGTHHIRTYTVMVGRVRLIADVLSDSDAQPINPEARDRFRSKLEYYMSEGYSRIFEPAYRGSTVAYRCHIRPEEAGGGFVSDILIQDREIGVFLRHSALAKAIGRVESPMALERAYGRYRNADLMLCESPWIYVVKGMGPIDTAGRLRPGRALPRSVTGGAP